LITLFAITIRDLKRPGGGHGELGVDRHRPRRLPKLRVQFDALMQVEINPQQRKTLREETEEFIAAQGAPEEGRAGSQ
jgi:hypothetical protein